MQVLLPSVRNTLWMNASLIRSRGCIKFFYSLEMLNKAEELGKEVDDLQLFAIPSLGIC